MIMMGENRLKTRVIKRNTNWLIKTLLLLGLTCMLTGCHGSKGMQSFEIPEEFDESKQYEITFWAKNDTNKTQTAVYEKAIEDFEKLGKTDPFFEKLAEITERNNGLWSAEAEKYLLENK